MHPRKRAHIFERAHGDADGDGYGDRDGQM
jgi:hypothetical protein